MHSIKDIVKQLIGKSLDAYNTKYTKVVNSRIDNIVAQAGNDNTEIVDARIDSAGVTHTTLNNRILAETKMNDEQLVEYTGINISAEDTTQGYLKDVEILGNTIQNEEDLADIKSVGVLQEDGTYKMSILSCGKNLLTLEKMWKAFSDTVDGTNDSSFDGDILSLKWNGNVRKANLTKIKFRENTRYTLSYWCKSADSGTWQRSMIRFEYTDGTQSNLTSSNTSNTEFTKQTITSLEGKTVKNIVVDLNNTLLINKIQLEEGTVATPYEPYQGNKCDILLPCQLEKVGDVADRLYYDDVEKAWCIEKNIVKIHLYESVHKMNGDWETLYFSKTLSFDKVKNASSYCISSLLNYNGQDISTEDTITQLCIFGHANNFECRIRLRKDEFPNITTNEDYIKWATENDFYILLQSATPQKIILPLSTQIQLNSFFGTTHIYMESGEVEGTIKCKIPKSLGATVQSLNNKTDILSDRIEAIEGLKDSQNMKYETDKGYLVCKETKNGVIDDLKIEGKTLVNKLILSNKSVTTVGFGYQIDLSKNIIPKGIYYVTNYNDKRVRININRGDGTGWIETINFDANSTKKINVDVDFFVANIQGLSSDGWNDSNKDSLCKSLIITETIQETGYFEGLMSVGQDVDEIVVESVKGDGNLISSECKVGTMFEIYAPKGEYVASCKSKQCTIRFYRKDKTLIDYWSLNGEETIYRSFVVLEDIYYVLFDGDINTTDIQLIKGNTPRQYTPHQSDKKQILFYNENGELEPIQELHEWDSIEKHSDNKWYYHKRSGKVVLNGNEDWLLKQVNTNCTVFALRETQLQNKIKLSPQGVSDKFAWESVLGLSTEVECIGGHSVDVNTIRIAVAKSKLSTQDVQGFKQWLQANNVTVVYQLAEEEVYEIAPLHLDSYANETLILCNSGAISPKMEFSITSHINELVKAYGERINLLEEKVYKYMVTQNRMQLASTYSADSVTFKVDYFSLCGDEENYDEDLYNLILNNILVGKDNYNYDKMFTMILDYASWNQISWEQFDILVGLMDMQHNPPVEELPTEDEIEEDIIENEETPVE